jgi:hypothetical protein
VTWARILVLAASSLAALAALLFLTDSVSSLLFPLQDRRVSQLQNRGSMLPKGAPIAFLSPRSIGNPIQGRERPQIAHVTTVDLDRDGLIDVVACDVLQNRVVWIRQSAGGMFTEIPIGDAVQAPAHAEAADIDRDGDLDVLVASLGVLYPSNARIGAVIVLENQGRQRFVNRLLVDSVARVSDARAGDLDGDGDLDLAVAQFGYDEGQTRWMQNQGGWRFTSTELQNLSGPINVEIVDIDRDGDLDIASLVSHVEVLNEIRQRLRRAAKLLQQRTRFVDDVGVVRVELQRAAREELASGSVAPQVRRAGQPEKENAAARLVRERVHHLVSWGGIGAERARASALSFGVGGAPLGPVDLAKQPVRGPKAGLGRDEALEDLPGSLDSALLERHARSSRARVDRGLGGRQSLGP